MLLAVRKVFKNVSETAPGSSPASWFARWPRGYRTVVSETALADLSPPAYSTHTVSVARARGACENDVVAVEEPLEIRIGGEPIAVTMRTPGHDEELALGFALGEGLEPTGASIPEGLPANTVELEAAAFDPARLRRSFYTTSSCGVCGKGALAAVAVVSAPSRST